MADFSSSLRARILLPAGLLAATALFFFVYLPSRPDVVLLWDQCHHLTGGLGVRDALASASPAAVLDEVLEPDLYPAGHSLVLGAWLLVAGDSPLSHQFFQLASLWLLVAALWFCSRCVEPERRKAFFVAAVFCTLLTSRVVPLAGCFMLGVPATATAVAALAALARLDMRCSRRRALIALLLMTFALLTKYNVALPLVPVALALALRRLLLKQGAEAITLAVVAVASVLVLALWLTLQDKGWEMFFRFARNRSNSEGWSPLARCVWYLRYYTAHFISPPPLGIGVGLLALWGLVRARSSLALAGAAYVLFSLGALSWHEYLLGRTLLPVAVVLTIPAAVGLGRLPVSPWPARSWLRRSAWAALAVGILWLNLPAITAATTRYYPPQRDLAALSQFVSGVFRTTDSCRVVGTFNAFSGGWARILWRREHGGAADRDLRLDFPRPEGIDGAAADPARLRFCEEKLDRWLARPSESLLLTLEVLDGSPLKTPGHRRHSAWKDDYVHCCVASAGLLQLGSRDFPDSGVRARLHAPIDRTQEWLRGWGPAESFGRWSRAEGAVVRLRRRFGQAALWLRVAPGEESPPQQVCRVIVDGAEVGAIEVGGPAWVWRDHLVSLPSGVTDSVLDVEFAFEPAVPAEDSRYQLAFAVCQLVAAP